MLSISMTEQFCNNLPDGAKCRLPSVLLAPRPLGLALFLSITDAELLNQ